MIFKRPDTFIIKHIKLVHAIILLGMTYLLYMTSNISSAYKEIVKEKSIIGTHYSSELYNPLMYIILIVCLLLVATILVLSIKRKKKFIFYIIMTALLGSLLVYYVLSYTNISTMEHSNVAAPVYMAYSDISEILFYIQSVLVIILLFKVAGFDIKTFSFGKVSYDLDLTDADEDEIEFSLEIDGNEIRTKRRRKTRNLKYFYLENRWKINAIVILVIAISAILIDTTIEAKKPIYYDLGNEFTTRNYTAVVNNVYLTSYDYLGKKIKSEGTFIIVKFKVKKNYEQEYVFDKDYIGVKVNGKTYYPDTKYYEYFEDLGIPYKEQKLSQEYQDYYLPYYIPYEFSTKDIYVKVAGNFDYNTNSYVNYEIKTTYERLENKEKIKEFKLNDEMNIEAYGINTKVTIKDFDIKEKFKLNFETKIKDPTADDSTKTKDYTNIEYVTPTAEDNEDKVLMKLNYEEQFADNNKTKFATILSKYAIIEYEIDNNKEEGKIYSYVSPKLSKEANVYYIQVSKKVLEGKNINIKIKIRDQVFKYQLDKGVEE